MGSQGDGAYRSPATLCPGASRGSSQNERPQELTQGEERAPLAAGSEEAEGPCASTVSKQNGDGIGGNISACAERDDRPSWASTQVGSRPITQGQERTEPGLHG